MLGLLMYIASVLVTLLPPRYRRDRPNLRGAALTCGIIQTTIGVFALVFHVIQFAQFAAQIQEGLGAQSEVIFDHMGGAAVYESGIFVIADVALRPYTMLLYYVIFEGLVRGMAALVGHQVIGTLPLYVVSGIHGLVDKAAYRSDIGPLIVDEVVRGAGKNYDLKVYSCRPKLDWNPYVTIEFEDQFYQMFKEEHGPKPRRFVYYLRKNPMGRLVVVIRHFKIDDVLNPKPRVYPGE